MYLSARTDARELLKKDEASDAHGAFLQRRT
jgi:hypothetical protein